jgi:hypothetical protein
MLTSTTHGAPMFAAPRTFDCAFADTAFADTAVPAHFAHSDSSRIDLEAADTELVLVIPPAVVSPRCKLSSVVEAGQRRVYNVNARLLVPLTAHSAPAEIDVVATWRLIVHEVTGDTTVWSGKLDIHDATIDGYDDRGRLASELSPLGLMSFERGVLQEVDAGRFVATEVMTRLARALSGMPDASDDSIALALTALGG